MKEADAPNENERRRHMKKKHGIRRITAFILAVLTLCALAIPSAASPAEEDTFGLPRGSERIPLYVDGTPVMQNSAYLINGLTYVPLRAFCDTFGDEFEISWNGISHTATAVSDTLTLKVQQDAYYITANERCFYTVGKVLNIDGRIYVPVRPMAKAFCLDLVWDGGSRSVYLTSTGETLMSAAQVYSPDDIYWLSRIINAEAGSEPFLGKIAVGNVVLNRVKSPLYPNTIWSVIFDRRYGTQFSPVSYGTIYNAPNADSITAARICLEGYTISDDILFFLNPRIATNFWIVKNCKFEFTIGNHSFYSPR